jgi:hypothetical protein
MVPRIRDGLERVGGAGSGGEQWDFVTETAVAKPQPPRLLRPARLLAAKGMLVESIFAEWTRYKWSNCALSSGPSIRHGSRSGRRLPI